MRCWARACWGLALLTGTVRAEYSPLSIDRDGVGLPVEEMGARERGMGDAGMAALSTQGYFLPNVSRAAFYTRTSFVATMESDLDWLQDDATSNRLTTLSVPTIATFIQAGNLGVLGLHYQEAYQRNFTVTTPSTSLDSVTKSYSAQGGVFLLGVSWAYSPIPLLAFGFTENLVLTRDRFIDAASFLTPAPPLVPENLAGDTTELRGTGSFPTFSTTLHTRWLDAAVSYSLGTTLHQSGSRTVTDMLADSLTGTTDRAWPFMFATGLAWRPSDNQTLAVDFYTEDWSGDSLSKLNQSYKVCLGYEHRGNPNPFEDYYKRMDYRAGFGQDRLYLENVPEFYGTMGVGLPLGPRGNLLDLSLKYAHRYYDGSTPFTEDYVQVTASVVGVGIWGRPARRRH